MKELDRVIGYDSIKRELIRILDILNNPEKYKALGVSTPHGILLNGVPGIGKSLLAKCFIEATGRKSYTIRKNKPDGEFVNHIRQTFEDAVSNAPSIILLDDMDKFANSDGNYSNTEEYVTIQSCIDSVKEKEVFVIATTNNIHLLPGSLTRSGRFDKTFSMSFPTDGDAQKIIAFYLENKNVADDIDTEEIARFAEGSSCADLETVINEAGIQAGFDGIESISQKYILNAILKKIVGFDDNDEISDTKLRRRAIHEAGHAVVTELLYPGAVSFATISTSNATFIGGLVKRKTNKIDRDIKEYIENSILITLAGKAATEVILQEVDIGANSDLSKAFDNTRMIIDNYCSYGFDTWGYVKASQNVYGKLDDITAAEMSRYYARTKKLLNDNRPFLEATIESLIEKKTLSYKDISVIREAA